MRANRIDKSLLREASSACGLSERDIEAAVSSYFGAFLADVKRLPLDTPRKIYRRDAFESFSMALHMPRVGRIGPVYSRYLKWRANEAASSAQPEDKAGGPRIWVVGAEGRKLAWQSPRRGKGGKKRK